jgi:hypothetical protein
MDIHSTGDPYEGREKLSVVKRYEVHRCGLPPDVRRGSATPASLAIQMGSALRSG